MHLFTHVRAKVALLFAGAFLWGAQAYADDDYVQIATDDFESEETYQTNWTLSRTDKTYIKYGSRSVDGVTSHFFCAVDNGINAEQVYAISNSEFLSASKWKLEFDFAGYSGNSGTGYFYVRNGSDNLITMSVASYTNSASVTSGSSTLGSISVDIYDKNTRGENPAVTIWHHLTLWDDGEAVYCTIGSSTGTDEIAKVKIAEAGTIHPNSVVLQAGKTLGQWALDDVTLSIVPTGILAPSLTSEGKSYTSKLITLTSKTSGVTIKYTLDDGDTEYTYENPFRIYKKTKVTAWAESGDEKSETYSETITAGEVAAPTISVAGVNGVKRTVAFASSTAGTSTKYKTSEDESDYIEASSVEISEKTEFIVIAILADEYSSEIFESSATKQTVDAGVEVQLAGVTYSANGDDVTFTANQSSVLCNPTVSINYTYIPADGSPEQSGTVENGGTKTLGYGTITAYASADGYANSATTSGVYAQLDLQLSSTFDFSRSEWGNHTKDLAVTYGEETVETINKIALTTIAIDGTIVKDFLVKPITSTSNGVTTNTWLKRGVADGLYPQAGTNFAVQNVKAGQVVVISGAYGNAAFEIGALSSNVELDVFRTTANSVYTYKCTEDGTVAFSMARYGYLDKVEVFDVVSTIDVAVTSAGYSTFFWDKPAKYDSDQVTAYTGTLSEDEKTLNLTEITTGVIPANTAVILKAEEGTYTFESAEAVDAISANALRGTTTDLITSEVTGTVYVLSTSAANGVGFYKFSGKTLAANKAYLVLPTASSAPMVRFNFDEGNVGNVTGIESIEAENGAQARIFDLQGRSLRQAPQKGMYILNGHKVIR